MDFDQMFETWRAQNTAPPFDVNRDALRQALQSEEARVLQEQRRWRRGLWFTSIFAIAMAVWATFWIAITITNGWPAIYAVTSVASIALFGSGAAVLWRSLGRKFKPNFANTLREEVRRNLALVDNQLFTTGRMLVVMLGTASICVGTFLFSWTINRSQDIPNQSSSGVFPILLILFFVWTSRKAREEMRRARPKLEFRQQRLRELLATLESSE